jgi:hypothetical protein
MEWEREQLQRSVVVHIWSSTLNKSKSGLVSSLDGAPNWYPLAEYGEGAVVVEMAIS